MIISDDNIHYENHFVSLTERIEIRARYFNNDDQVSSQFSKEKSKTKSYSV